MKINKIQKKKQLQYQNNCRFLHDFSKIQISKLLINLRFYFQDVTEQLKTNTFEFVNFYMTAKRAVILVRKVT